MTLCGKDIYNFWATPLVVTPCARPEGHEGHCWPILLTTDPRDDESPYLSPEAERAMRARLDDFADHRRRARAKLRGGAS